MQPKHLSQNQRLELQPKLTLEDRMELQELRQDVDTMVFNLGKLTANLERVLHSVVDEAEIEKLNIQEFGSRSSGI